MDFLFLDRPVLFYCPDMDEYIEKDRGIIFDYDWITPGEKCRDQDSLFDELYRHLIEGEDPYAERRKEIRDIAWSHQDAGASERIWTAMKEEFGLG